MAAVVIISKALFLLPGWNFCLKEEKEMRNVVSGFNTSTLAVFASMQKLSIPSHLGPQEPLEQLNIFMFTEFTCSNYRIRLQCFVKSQRLPVTAYKYPCLNWFY